MRLAIATLITFVVLGATPRDLSACATIDGAINLSLQCVNVGESFFAVDLLRYDNPADPAGLYWEFGGVDGADYNGSCATVDGELGLAIPCVDVAGTPFGVDLAPYQNPADPGGLYWQFSAVRNGVDMTVPRTSLTGVENTLLARINGERQGAGLPNLVRDSGLDWVIYWHVRNMAEGHFLSHADENSRRAEARVRYYSGDGSVRCSEIIQWWGGSPSGDVHYTGYLNSPSHHAAYMEEGVFNLGPTTHAGVAAVAGTGPDGSGFQGRNGSYSAVLFCNRPVQLGIDPFSEDAPQ